MNPNSEPLRLLIVEDSEAAAQSVLRELAQHGFQLTHRRVTTKTDFLDALKAGTWDAVIADYVLERFLGLEALRCLREMNLDLPFIMVSGIYGEDVAVAMMQAGANDYLMKHNLARLASTLERELAGARQRRQLKQAESATQFLAAIVESSEYAIYGKSLDSIIQTWNPAAERIYGYAAGEIIGKSIALLFPADRRDELLDILSAVRRGEVVGLRETERRHKHGKIIPVSVTVSPVKNASGKIIGASAVARDITEQKARELERQQIIEKLTEASRHAHQLAGMLPICAACKRIRDDKGYWQQVENYISERSDAVFSHGLCPKCLAELEGKS